jgi:hypothetical protein
MANEQIVETGIDKLVILVKSSGKMSVKEAAKELGVDKNVIMEWADSLESEGLISFEYKLLNTFLVLRDMTKKEVETNSKELNGKKEIIVRRARGILTNFSKEEEKFKERFDEFSSLRNITNKTKFVRKEIQEFENLKQIKIDLDNGVKDSKNNLAVLKDCMSKLNSKAKIKYGSLSTVQKSSLEELEKALAKIEESKKELVSYFNSINKKMEAMSIIAHMDNDRSKLKDELSKLVKKAESIQIHSENGNSAKDVTDIENKFGEINNKNALLSEGYQKLARMPALFGIFNR